MASVNQLDYQYDDFFDEEGKLKPLDVGAIQFSLMDVNDYEAYLEVSVCAGFVSQFKIYYQCTTWELSELTDDLERFFTDLKGSASARGYYSQIKFTVGNQEQNTIRLDLDVFDRAYVCSTSVALTERHIPQDRIPFIYRWFWEVNRLIGEEMQGTTY